MSGGDATAQVPVLSAADLAAAGRKPPFPCALRLDDGSHLELLRPLRVLPGKRITGEGRWNGRQVLAKLFIAPGSARHWKREHDGLAALAAAALPSPPMLAAGTLAQGGHYLLTVFLPVPCLADEMADGIEAKTEIAHPPLAGVCALIGQLHAHGLRHEDMHPGNFLIDAGVPLIIDGAAVRRCASPLPAPEADSNLAQFLAQLPDVPLEPLLAAYHGDNPRHRPKAADLLPLIAEHRRKRLADYLSKTVRPCTLFDVQQSFRRFTAVARDDAALLAPLLADPDRAMANGVLLKDGNTATVARVASTDSAAGRTWIIKRYNIKSAAHALSRAWRPSRAWHSWQEGQRLHFLGIDTPMPRALIEERLGPLRRRAWLIADDCAGPSLAEHLAPCVEAAAPPPTEAAALLRFVEALCAQRISHGDFKASNLLWDEARGRVVVIDLDAMVQHASPAAHARAWQRDRARLLANWPAESGLYRWLDEHLPP